MTTNIPKRPRTAYFKFADEQKPILHLRYPNWKNIDIISEIAHMWKDLPSEQRQPYEEAFEEECVKFRRAKNEHQLQTLQVKS